jgi:hypothetical protein
MDSWHGLNVSPRRRFHLLAYMLYSRMAGENEGRIAVAEDVVHTARDFGEGAL